MTASVTHLPTSTAQLDDATDNELVRLVQSLPRGSEDHDIACGKLVARYQSLVRSCALRYRQSPEPQRS